jgi:hypothetical protein
MYWGSNEERRGAQPAAEARNAEGASEVALLIPRPPELIGRDACFHESSSREILQTDSNKERWTVSNDSKRPEEKHGAVLKT